MKKFLAILIIFAAGFKAQAQMDPISWTFSAVKITDKDYEIHLKATIQSGWHLYSQKQPGDAIAEPTSIKVNANPLFKTDDKIKEVGKMEVMKDASLGISANQYSQSVEFVQKIKLKAAVKTNFTGSIEYQTCNDKKCLPTKKITFSVPVK